MNRWLSALILLSLAACGGGSDSSTAPTGGGTLVIEDLVVGTGATAAVGDTVNVHYVGTLTNGTKFDKPPTTAARPIRSSSAPAG